MVTIHQFNPEIYPIKLWISVTMDIEELQKRFSYLNNGELDLSAIQKNEAFACLVIHKENGYKGILIIFTEKRNMSIKTISHEATHAAHLLWWHIGENTPGDEANAYFVGWVANCCETVKNYKKEKDGQANNSVN